MKSRWYDNYDNFPLRNEGREKNSIDNSVMKKIIANSPKTNRKWDCILTESKSFDNYLMEIATSLFQRKKQNPFLKHIVSYHSWQTEKFETMGWKW